MMRSRSLRAAEDEEAENRGSVLGDFGVWPGLIKWTSTKGEMSLSARKFGLKAVQTRKTSAFFFLDHDQRI